MLMLTVGEFQMLCRVILTCTNEPKHSDITELRDHKIIFLGLA